MFVFSLLLIIILTVADQVIKIAVNGGIELGEVIEVIKFGEVKIFSLTHIRNSGAAWSIMEGKTWFLIALPIVVCMIGLVYMYKIRNGSKLELISLAMLVAGGVGNLIDRVSMGEVIDYIKFEPVNFPIFNFADICVVIGAILFCVSIFITDVVKEKQQKQAESEAENE